MNFKKIQMILDVVGILLLLGVCVYLGLNQDYIYNMVKDPCRVCEQKTGGVCISNSSLNFPTQQESKPLPIGVLISPNLSLAK